jgi:uncharacterized protein YycO
MDTGLPELMAGDLIFAKWKVHTEHVAMYVGGGLVVHAVPIRVGCVHLNRLEEHWVFKWFRGIGSIYRVSGASDEERDRVVQYAINQVCKPFSLFSFKKFGFFWNCAKLVWRSWLEGTNGRIDLDQHSGIFVSAKDLMDSPDTYKITP